MYAKICHHPDLPMSCKRLAVTANAGTNDIKAKINHTTKKDVICRAKNTEIIFTKITNK